MATKKKPAPRKRPTDVNELAHLIGNRATGVVDDPSADQISAVMSALGRRGGKVGGRARAEALSPARRKEIAKKAAAKRWNKKTK